MEIESSQTRYSSQYAHELSNLIRDYESSSRNNNSNEAAIYCSIAAAIFLLQGCELSAELVTHFYQNDILNSMYIPNLLNYAYIYNVPKFYNLAYGTTELGTGSFEMSDNIDLYYAVHAFSYYRATNKCYQIMIEDRYDFDGTETNLFNILVDGISLQDALDMFYTLQQSGDLLPYYIIMDPAYGGTHSFECSLFDGVAHTLNCTNCNYFMIEAHDYYQIGNMLYCNTCPYSARYGLVGPGLLKN